MSLNDLFKCKLTLSTNMCAIAVRININIIYTYGLNRNISIGCSQRSPITANNMPINGFIKIITNPRRAVRKITVVIGLSYNELPICNPSKPMNMK